MLAQPGARTNQPDMSHQHEERSRHPQRKTDAVTSQLLPRDALVKVFSFLKAHDLGKCSVVCRPFHEASLEQNLWHDLAVHKFGKEIAEATLSFYDGDWKKMMADDNRKGAFPTLTFNNKPCMYKHASVDYFFCCIVHSIQWNRSEDQVRVYIDARGEVDLRHPRRSTIRRVIRNDIVAATMGPNWRILVGQEGNWIGEVEKEGHFKGALVFNHESFQLGAYRFCYANRFHEDGADYESIPIFTKTSSESPFPYDSYTLDVSPFANDTPETERLRWEGVVPEDVLQRRHGRFGRRRQWWV